MNPSVSRVPRNQFGEAKQKKKAPVTSPFRKPLLCVGTQRFPLPRITVKTLAPFQRADFFCLNEAKVMQTQPTTPFGRRSLSLAMVANQASTRDFAGKPGNLETVVHKWRLFRALTEAKTPLGVTDRALSVLHALLSFHQETALTLPAADPRADDEDGDGSAGIVVFP